MFINDLEKINTINDNNSLLIETINGSKRIDAEHLVSEGFERLVSNNAGYHNSIAVGRDLTSLTNNEICSTITDGTFKNRNVADFFTRTITSSIGGTEEVDFVLADFNTYFNNGDTALTRNHVVVVTKDCLKTLAPMNETHTTVGGFVGSKMWNETLKAYEEALQNEFGSLLISRRSLLTTEMTETMDSNAGAGFKGASTNCAWHDCKVNLLSEMELYGANVLSSSFYDTGERNRQLSLFRLCPQYKVARLGKNGSREWYWLTNVASASYFALCGNYGDSGYGSAGFSGGVRLCFLIG